jgi:hypothetical protein
VKRKFKKSVALDANSSRLGIEGALTVAAIGLMVALVLQSEAMASQGEEMGPERSLSFDMTRSPAQAGPVRFRPGEDLRLKNVAPYAIPEALPFSPIEPLAFQGPALQPYQSPLPDLTTGGIGVAQFGGGNRSRGAGGGGVGQRRKRERQRLPAGKGAHAHRREGDLRARG